MQALTHSGFHVSLPCFELPRSSNLTGSRGHFNAICDFVVLLRATSPTTASQVRVEELMSKCRHWLWMRSKSFEVVRMSFVRLESITADFCDSLNA